MHLLEFLAGLRYGQTDSNSLPIKHGCQSSSKMKGNISKDAMVAMGEVHLYVAISRK